MGTLNPCSNAPPLPLFTAVPLCTTAVLQGSLRVIARSCAMQQLQDHPQHLMPPSPEQVLFFGEFRPKEGGEVDEVCVCLLRQQQRGRSLGRDRDSRQGSSSMFLARFPHTISTLCIVLLTLATFSVVEGVLQQYCCGLI